MSDLKVFNAGLDNVFVWYALLFVGKFLHFEKKIQVFIGYCTILIKKTYSEKKRKIKN